MAKWIWNSKATKVNAYVNFICECDITEAAPDAVIKVSADSEYVLWVNGCFVNCGQYDDFPDRKVYDSLPVAEYLKVGKNRICFLVYYQGKSSFQYAVGEPGLWFEIVNGLQVIEGDENVLSAVDDAYYQDEMYLTTVQLGYGFAYDARREDEWLHHNTTRFEKSIVREGTVPAPRPIEKCVFGKMNALEIKTQGVFMCPESSGDISVDMQRAFLSHRSFEELFEAIELPGNSQTGVQQKEKTEAEALPGKMLPMQSLHDSGQIESGRYLKVLSTENLYFIVDMGKEISGYFHIDLEAAEGTVIDFAYGEHLEDLRVRSSIGSRHFANRYICKEGRQKYTYYARRMAGRYLQFHVTGRFYNIYDAGLIPSDYPLADYMDFKSEDALKNKIFEISKDTLLRCMHEHYEDCPWREQALYGSDSRNQMLAGYYAFREFKFARASLDLLGQSMKEGPWLGICAPTDEKLYIPSFTLVWVLAMKEYAQYSGDYSLVLKYMDKFRLMFAEYTKNMQNGLVQPPVGNGAWTFYEWTEGNYGPGLGSIEADADGLYQVFLYVALHSMAWLCEAMGEPGRFMSLANDEQQGEIINDIREIRYFKEQLEQTMSEIKAAVNDIFWDEKKGVYANYLHQGELQEYSELMQAMAIYSGIAGEHTESLCEVLAGENNLAKVTLSYLVYKYDALLAQGEKYKDLVFEEINAKWGRMLFSGATSFWETEDGAKAFGNAGSLCHGWSATPIYLYGRYLCGIGPKEIQEGKR